MRQRHKGQGLVPIDPKTEFVILLNTSRSQNSGLSKVPREDSEKPDMSSNEGH